MMDYQKVRVGHDRERDAYKRAMVHRAVLEAYSHCVTMHDLWGEERVRRFFGTKDDSALTLVECHGSGKNDGEAVINFSVLRHKQGPEFESVEFHVTPANVREVVKAGSGIIIMNACWAGKLSFADAFLSAGFSAYIAPAKTSDQWSGLQFITAFIGYLMYEVRDWGARKVDVREAFDMARRIDDFWDGAKGWQLFDSDGGAVNNCAR